MSKTINEFDTPNWHDNLYKLNNSGKPLSQSQVQWLNEWWQETKSYFESKLEDQKKLNDLFRGIVDGRIIIIKEKDREIKFHKMSIKALQDSVDMLTKVRDERDREIAELKKECNRWMDVSLEDQDEIKELKQKLEGYESLVSQFISFRVNGSRRDFDKLESDFNKLLNKNEKKSEHDWQFGMYEHSPLRCSKCNETMKAD